MALQRANMEEVHKEEQAFVKATAPKVPQIPQQLKIATIEGDSDSDEDRKGSRHSRGSGNRNNGGSVLPSGTSLGISSAPALGDRPPSPRSMLSNPKFGSKIVASAPLRAVENEAYHGGGSYEHQEEPRPGYDRGFGSFGAGGAPPPKMFAPSPTLPRRPEPEPEPDRVMLQPQQINSGRGSGAPPPKMFAPSPSLPRRPPPPEENDEEEADRLVLAPEPQPRAVASMRRTAEEMEVLTLGPVAGSSQSGRPPVAPRSLASPRKDMHAGPSATGRGASPSASLNTSLRHSAGHASPSASLNASLRHSAGHASSTVDTNSWDSDEEQEEQPPARSQARQQAAAPPPLPMPPPPRHAAPAVQVADEPWDSDDNETVSMASPGQQQQPRREAALHVGARWNKASSGKWEADDGASPRGIMSPGAPTAGRAAQPPSPSERPLAGVKMDRNFVEDDWDSDDE